MTARPLVLLLHLGVVVLTPLADARIERDALPVGVHVEREDGQACPPGHDHLLCPVCRHLTSSSASPAGPTAAFAPHRFAATGAPHAALLATPSCDFVPLGPRAPPAV